jgi:hypothetical protein
VIGVFLKQHETIPDSIGQHSPGVAHDLLELQRVLNESAQRVTGAQRIRCYRSARKSLPLRVCLLDKAGDSPPAVVVPS